MKNNRFGWIKSGTPWIWLTAGSVSISLISVLGLLLLIGWKGLVYFWPTPVYQWQDKDESILLGQVYQRDYVSLDHLSEQGRKWPQSIIDKGEVERLSIKVANREILSSGFYFGVSHRFIP